MSLKPNLNNPYHHIIIEEVGEHNIQLHAIAKIYEFLVLPTELHISWIKCHIVGDTTVFLAFITVSCK